MTPKEKLMILAIAKSTTSAIIKDVLCDIEREILKHTESHEGYKWIRVTHLKLALRGIRSEALQRLENVWGKTRK
jgi:hypothetical protein